MPRIVPSRKALLIFVLGLALVFSFSSCSDDEKPPTSPGGGGGSTSFFGVVTTGSVGGKLNITISAASLAPRWGGQGSAPRWGGHRSALTVVNATGTATIYGASISLTGSYDTVTDSLKLTGGAYTFKGRWGNYWHDALVGTWTGSGHSGNFFCYVGQLGTNEIYTGTYESSPPDSGSFSFVLANGTGISGFALSRQYSGSAFYYEGTVGGSAPLKTITIFYHPPEYTLDGSGFLDTTADSVHGTYTLVDIAGGAGSSSGTWSGKKVP